MNLMLIIIMVLFFIIAGSVGLQRAIIFIPTLLILGIVGYLFVAFLPLIIVFLAIQLVYTIFIKKKQPHARTRTYYYRTGNAQDFEEFFRGYSSQGGYYSNGNGSYYNQGSSSYQNPFEDKTKYYTVLGIQPGASKDEIKRAFREQAKKHHPDKFANESQEVRDYHEKKFKEINEAYEKLAG